MLRFHVHLRGSEPASGLSVTFDGCLEALAQLRRLFIEPDGSFVWTGNDSEGQAWQVDGNLLDRGDRLDYVELKGSCPSDQLDRLLAIFGSPGRALAFQLPRQGITLDAAEFRELAASASGAF